MRWKKLGRIFDPTQFALPNGCTHFAQSPQALVFDDRVRIYFSTRSLEAATGKYLSQVAWADFDKGLGRVLRVSSRAALELGGLGCFDEHGIFPLSPVRVDDAVYAYTTGWSRRVSVSVETTIGLAISRDGGERFERVGTGPVLAPSLREPYLVGDGFVRRFGGRFHMWYIFGTRWKRPVSGGEPERTYKIGHAVSDDGVAWEKEEGRQIVPDRLGPDESQALPTVLRIGDRWHMFFCYRQSFDFRSNRERAYRIGHASSGDLEIWERADDDPRLEVEDRGWDADMMCYPNAFECEGRVYLLYNGNQFGRYGFGAAVLE